MREPAPNCRRCPRLVALRREVRRAHPAHHAAPVRVFGPPDAALLVIGLAPGLHGANATGRPFTGDYAGDPAAAHRSLLATMSPTLQVKTQTQM